MPIAQDTDTLELTDPRAMRALAHPVRLSILELLHLQPTANATECARHGWSCPAMESAIMRVVTAATLISNVLQIVIEETPRPHDYPRAIEKGTHGAPRDSTANAPA